MEFLERLPGMRGSASWPLPGGGGAVCFFSITLSQEERDTASLCRLRAVRASFCASLLILSVIHPRVPDAVP